MSKKIKILNTEVIDDNKKSIKTRPFFRLTKKKLVFLTVSLLLIISLLLIPRDYYKSSIRKILAMAGIYTEEIKSVEIESNDYNNPGSFKITKSAKWLSTNKVQITFDVDSILKTDGNYKDIILVLDTSGSMIGEKLTKVISDSKKLVNILLNDTHNRIALITFNSTSEVLSTFTNDKDSILGLLDNISTNGLTNYNAALQKIDTVMTNYIKQTDTDVVTLFLTDGHPNLNTPSEKATYTYLKDKYPYLTINGIQYEIGKEVINEITAISDNQFVANRNTLIDVLIEASISPILYEKLIIEDYINTDYFNITSTDDINTSQGTVNIEEALGEKKVVWNLGDNSYVTGSSKKMTIDLTLNDTLPSNKTFYPTNTKEVITYKLGAGEEETITSTDTPVLTNKYSVIYDNNTPDGCVIENNTLEEYQIFTTVSKSTNEITCPGYHFRGWKIDEDDDSDITHINENLFIMPGHDVTVRAEWSNQSITKSFNGTVNTHSTLYKVLKDEAESNGLAIEYTGAHQDSMDETKSTEKIYYYYGSNTTDGNAIKNKNNVIFADHCWQMIRTTDTGGVKMIYNGEADNNKCLSTRGTHVGYAASSTQSLNSYYWYGTDYTYDSENGLFSISNNLERKKWDSTTWNDLIGKYTCKSSLETGTCSTLYYVESYYSNTQANTILINSSSNYSSFGNLEFNKEQYALSYVGYKYGDVYEYNTYNVINSASFESSERLLDGTSSLNTTFYYGDSITFDSATGKYSLVNQFKISSISEYTNLVGKYTFGSNVSNNKESYVYYIANVNGSIGYSKTLKDGEMLSDFEPIVFGDSFTNNGDGTYTLNNPVTTNLINWGSNNSNFLNMYTCNEKTAICTTPPRFVTSTLRTAYSYINTDEIITIGKGRNGLSLTNYITISKADLIKNRGNYSEYKYTCNNNSITCTEQNLRLITEYTSSGYKYAPNIYYGSSVTWDGTNYTLIDPIEMENYNKLNNLSTHHYICSNVGEKTCQTVYYIYYHTGTTAFYYITLKNGVDSVSKALDNMFTKNTTDSTMKNGVEAWYKKYILDYDDFLEDVIYCNDRSIRDYGGWKDNGGALNQYLNLRGHTLINKLDCPNNTDQFSVSNDAAKLKYKVGLPSAPEVTLMNTDSARANSNYYWLITPYSYLNYNYARMRLVHPGGNVNNNSVGDPRGGVRPAISLKPGTEYYTGDGSMEHPYIVDLGE